MDQILNISLFFYFSKSSKVSISFSLWNWKSSIKKSIWVQWSMFALKLQNLKTKDVYLSNTKFPELKRRIKRRNFCLKTKFFPQKKIVRKISWKDRILKKCQERLDFRQFKESLKQSTKLRIRKINTTLISLRKIIFQPSNWIHYEILSSKIWSQKNS